MTDNPQNTRLPEDTQVGVVGLGNWGTALAHHLASKGFTVVGWCREPDIAHAINTTHRNSSYQTDIQLHAKVTATTELARLKDCPVIVLAVPSQFLASVLSHLQLAESVLVVSVIKGLDRETLLPPMELAGKCLPQGTKLGVLSGPSFASNVIRGLPCGLVAASFSEEVAFDIAQLFSSDRMRIYVSTDPIGVEVASIVKNVIAVATGICDGLGFGESARAGLITRGLAEMTRLAEAMGGQVRTMSGLAGLGDLVMTATSDLSRNRTVGVRLGKGETLAEIVATLGSVAEGVSTAPIVEELAKRHGVEMPITTEVVKLLRGETKIDQTIAALLNRPIKREF